MFLTVSVFLLSSSSCNLAIVCSTYISRYLACFVLFWSSGAIFRALLALSFPKGERG